MSYWVYLDADLGGTALATVHEANMTSNVASMWRKAGADLALMDGAPAGECGSVITRAAQRIRADVDGEYSALNPPNGWGDHESCAAFLEELAGAIAAYPRTMIRISR